MQVVVLHGRARRRRRRAPRTPAGTPAAGRGAGRATAAGTRAGRRSGTPAASAAGTSACRPLLQRGVGGEQARPAGEGVVAAAQLLARRGAGRAARPGAWPGRRTSPRLVGSSASSRASCGAARPAALEPDSRRTAAEAHRQRPRPLAVDHRLAGQARAQRAQSSGARERWPRHGAGLPSRPARRAATPPTSSATSPLPRARARPGTWRPARSRRRPAPGR